MPGHVEEAWLATRIYDGGLVSWQDTRRGLGQLSGTVPRHMEEAWLAVRNSARTRGGGLVSYQDI